ncbi:MAG: pyridoxal phosphate-dependent aminotransferase [Acidobacteriota bacterium]
MFSNRLPWNASVNRITAAVGSRRLSGQELIDLTETNPTRAGLPWPGEELGEALRRGAMARYRPDPGGLVSAREAIAVFLTERGESVSPSDLVLTASTSEAYAWIFKCLGDAGDEILTALPSYPLLENLARLEDLTLRHFPLELDRRWRLDAAAVSSAMNRHTRAVVVIHPGNPAGNYFQPEEQRELTNLCAAHSCALIADEVFFDYPVEATAAVSFAETGGECLTFALGGLSKSAGFPHLKLSWIRLSGPEDLCHRAHNALESVGDNYLSLSTPVQSALAEILQIGAAMRASIRARTAENMSILRRTFAGLPAARVLPVEGGWSAVIRVPSILSDEEFAIHLLETTGVLVSPGYFFDFSSEGYLVVSLICEPGEFQQGATRLRDFIVELID